MTVGDPIIDLAADPLAERAERRRHLLRIGVPVLGVVMTIAVILGIAVYANQANTEGALVLSDDILAALDARIGAEVADYFGPAKRGLVIARDLVAGETADERQILFEKFALSALREIPQIADLSLADSDGNFLMISRNDTSSAFDTKLIRNIPGPRTVRWVRRDRQGRQTAREEDPTDNYDPRTRSWFTGALAANGLYWTEVYNFYTKAQPGITASARVPVGQGTPLVIGVDITVTDLSRFLKTLPIGAAGRAMIIDSGGRVIAHPDREKDWRQGSHDDSGPRIDGIGDAAAVAAYDRFRVVGPGRRTVEVGGRQYLTSITPIDVAGHDWSILIIAPERDFVGFVARNNRTGVIMSLAIVVLTTIGAGLLVRQGLRADRATRLALDRARAVGRQGEIFRRLADTPELFDLSQEGPDAAPTALTEVAVEISGARRASLWYLRADGETLRCADSFQRDGALHAAEFEVRRGELPRFFDHLADATEIDVADAAADPRTADLHRLLLAPLGTRSLSLFPVRRQEKLVGVLWLEDPPDLGLSRQFLRVLAGLAAIHREALPAAPQPLLPVSAGAEVGEPRQAYSVSAGLSPQVVNSATLGGSFFADVSVLALSLDEAAASANEHRSPRLVDAIVCAMQELAADHDVPYLKIVGSDIIGAAGFAGDPTAAGRIASAAIVGRERIAALFEADGLAPTFRLGIDCGQVIGEDIGTSPRIFNVWSGAVDTARTLAAGGLPGAIQVSAAAYTRLRDSFLFRPRGSFYLPSVGATQTFILAGRL